MTTRIGLGAIGSNLTQITSDTGTIANVFHGFEGQASGVGALALYVAKVETPVWFFNSAGSMKSRSTTS